MSNSASSCQPPSTGSTVADFTKMPSAAYAEKAKKKVAIARITPRALARIPAPQARKKAVIQDANVIAALEAVGIILPHSRRSHDRIPRSARRRSVWYERDS